MRTLVKAGADPNALERDRYDIVTIAAVADDVPTLETALALGASARNVTSRYDGTALIAAAHLGHDERRAHADPRRRTARPRQQPRLDRADRIHRAGRRRSAPHGDDEGADRRRRQLNLADRSGATPLALARGRGFGTWWRCLRRPGHADSRHGALTHIADALVDPSHPRAAHERPARSTLRTTGRAACGARSP